MVTPISGPGFGAAYPRPGHSESVPENPAQPDAASAQNAGNSSGTSESTQSVSGNDPKNAAGDTDRQGNKDAGSRSAQSQELSKSDQQLVRELKARDQEVRRHEQAHISAGGQYVRGAASFSFQTGPDGKRYAVGGEVSIDTGEERTAEATIRKSQAIKRAALAPANPSGQDRAVAAAAGQMEIQARRELSSQNAEESDEAGQVQGSPELDNDSETSQVNGSANAVDSPNPPESRQGTRSAPSTTTSRIRDTTFNPTDSTYGNEPSRTEGVQIDFTA